MAKDRGDGTVRNFMPGHRRGGAWLPALTSALAATQGIAPPDTPFALTYYRTANGEPFAFPRYPAHTVALLPPAWFKDKYVLIGTDLPASDRHRTPFALLDGPERGNLAGVVIHAHSLAQLIAGDRLVVVHGARLAAVIALLAGLSLAVAYINVGPYRRIFLVLALLAALWTGTVVLFHYRGMLMPLALPSLAIAFVNGLASTHVWYRDRQRRKFIENAFSRYVSPAYVRTLIDHPEELRLGGQRREVTYVFTDIAGFTSLAEATEPQILSGLINRYLDGLCGPVARSRSNSAVAVAPRAATKELIALQPCQLENDTPCVTSTLALTSQECQYRFPKNKLRASHTDRGSLASGKPRHAKESTYEIPSST